MIMKKLKYKILIYPKKEMINSSIKKYNVPLMDEIFFWVDYINSKIPFWIKAS